MKLKHCNKQLIRLLTLLISMALVGSAALLTPPKVAYAATTVTFDISKGSVNITGSTYSGYNSSGTKISGSSSGVSFVITGTTTTNKVTVSGTQNITLSDCSIDMSSTGNSNNPGDAAFCIVDNNTGNVNVILVGENILKSSTFNAGLQKSGNASTGTLTILGTGSLTALGGKDSAGIGGAFHADCSNIIIGGGTVTATGGSTDNLGGAGTGSGCGGDCSNITISGGVVKATGGIYAAGIGGGDGFVSDGAGSYITITGGTVTATGGGYATGIGGGRRGLGSHIVISGGSVKATGTNANAIGGGWDQDAVTPTDGNGDNVYLKTISNPGSKFNLNASTL